MWRNFQTSNSNTVTSTGNFLEDNQWWPVKSCKLHFAAAPIKMVRASKQYMYDDAGAEYLDCINNVSHVGHCHPQVVAAGQEQMAKLMTSSGFLSDVQAMYAKRLVGTLPERLCVCYFVNSGSEANDLALRLAQEYSGNEDVVVVSDAFHGNLGNLIDISPLRWNSNTKGKDHVHIIPCPNVYRGNYREDTPHVVETYINEAHKIIKSAQSSGRRIGAFMCDPLMTSSGFFPHTAHFLKSVYRFVRDAGGLCIADEVQVGLGRVGEHYWAFQCQDVIPDIITCGKPLGNGHPLAVVITTKDIADRFGDFSSSFGGNPVSCAIGLSVLDVIKNEQLMSSAKCVGRNLVEGFRNIQGKHPMMGQVRGRGMVIAIEIVTDKESRKPAKEAAELLAYKMKEDKILIANEGPDKNIMLMLPPMCLTCENARQVIQSFDKCLAEIENGLCPEDLPQGPQLIETTQITIPANVLTSPVAMDETGEGPLRKQSRCDYDDVD